MHLELLAGVYKHYKGGYYQALGIAAHSETDERLVVYVSIRPAPGVKLLPGPRLRVRPATEWSDIVKGLDGTLVLRFAHVGQEIPAEVEAPLEK